MPISDGLRVTVKPLSSITASLASAVSAPPEISAPAWPMRLPGGAVTPAMKPTIGFFMLSLAQRAASASSGPPISPIMMTASVSGSSLNRLHHVDVLQAVDRVATDADGARLAEADLGELGRRLRTVSVPERLDDADAALAVDVARHDADLDFIGGDEARAVGAQQQRLLATLGFLGLHAVAQFEHVADGDAFGDADGQVQVGLDGLPDGGGSARGRHVDHADRGAGLSLAASLTLAKMGMPSKSSPAFFGFTPATNAALPFA